MIRSPSPSRDKHMCPDYLCMQTTHNYQLVVVHVVIHKNEGQHSYQQNKHVRVQDMHKEGIPLPEGSMDSFLGYEHEV